MVDEQSHPDIRQLTQSLHLFRAHGKILLHRIIYPNVAYPDGLYIELDKLVNFFDSLG